jgi:hypothetical protein
VTVPPYGDPPRPSPRPRPHPTPQPNRVPEPAYSPGYGGGAPQPLRDKPSRWPFLLLVVVLAAAGGLIGYRVVHGDSSGPDYPKAWDKRVQFAVDFVEKERGLTFKHPVEVDFLSDAVFQKRVAGDPSALTGAQRSELSDLAASYRAVGLAHGRIDLGKALSQLRGGSVIGLYDFHTKKVYVRGQTLTVFGRVTLVHELTHALQDQYFAVGAYEDSTARKDSSTEDAFRAVVEGDATRIENAYLSSLTSAQRSEVARQQRATARAADKAIRGVPKILVTTQAAPYGLGLALLDYTVRAKGTPAVDELFRNWPTSDMELLQPWRYFAGDKPVAVPLPALRSGEKRLRKGSFGAASWYFLLATVLGPQRALTAVDGWAGDAMVAYRAGAHTCVRAAYRAVDAAALRTFGRAVARWIAAEPALRAHKSVAGRTLTLQSCDPGASAAAVGSDNSGAALQVAVARVDLATGLIQGGLSATRAVCGAKYVVAHLSTAQLTTTTATPAIRRAVVKGVSACRS